MFSFTVLFFLVSAREQRTTSAQEAQQFVVPQEGPDVAGEGPIRHADWFDRLWQKRRSQWAAQLKQDQGALIFLGDSITQAWNDDFRGWFSDIKTANRGISGDTTRGVLYRLNEDVMAFKPQGVVLLIGTNDLEAGGTPQQAANNFKKMVTIFETRPDMPVVVCLVFPSSAEKKRPKDQILEINRLYAEAVKGKPQFTVVDTWTLFANENGDANKDEFPDLLHLNEAAYGKWARAINPILATLGLHEQEPEATVSEDGFQALFNEKDLTGWCYRPTSKEMRAQATRWQSRDPNAPPWPFVDELIAFDGKTATPEDRYRAIAGRLVAATPPEGRKIQQIWTMDEFNRDFTLKLQFRATPNADSGIFLRGKQLQCRDYGLAGPYHDLKKYREGEWNDIVVTVRGNQARCTCNGELLEEALLIPEEGPIGLEGDRGQVEYRHIRLRIDE